jgi:hypothetical protein
VTILGKSCFSNCGSLESATFESNSAIERIQGEAFLDSGLRSILIPRSLEILGYGCFRNCGCLTSLTFESESRLSRINGKAFSSSAVKVLEIPNSVVSIDASALDGLRLDSLTIASGESSFRLVRCFLESADGRHIFRYLGSELEVMIVNPVETVGRSCFFECKGLETITFECDSCVYLLGESAFSGSGLKHVILTQSVVLIDRLCFFECVSLTSFTFDPDSKLQRIADYAFSRSAVTRLTLPRSLEVIGKDCFSVCFALESVTIEAPSRLHLIEDDAFSASALKAFVVPALVSVIGMFCFADCEALKTVRFDSGADLREIGESAFARTAIRQIAIPRLVEVIGRNCFSGCFALESVVFDITLKLQRIEEHAFAFCTKLGRMAFPRSIRFIDKSVIEENAQRAIRILSSEEERRMTKARDRVERTPMLPSFPHLSPIRNLGSSTEERMGMARFTKRPPSVVSKSAGFSRKVRALDD